MAKHKATTKAKSKDRSRSKGPGRHVVGVPLVEVAPVIVDPFDAILHDQTETPIAAVVPVSLAGLSTADEIAAAWSSESEQLAEARRVRAERAEQRRKAREDASYAAARDAETAAAAEADRIHSLRDDVVAVELPTFEAETTPVVEYPVFEPVEVIDVPAEFANTDAVTAEEAALLASIAQPDTVVEVAPEPVFEFEPAAETVAEPVVEVAPAEAANPFAFDFTFAEPAAPTVEDAPAPAAEPAPFSFGDFEFAPAVEEAAADLVDEVIEVEHDVEDVVELVEPDLAVEVEPEDDDVIDPEIVDETTAGTVVAEMVVDESKAVVAPAQPNIVEVHHHHYEAAQPVAPQIIIAPPPIYASEWPVDLSQAQQFQQPQGPQQAPQQRPQYQQPQYQQPQYQPQQPVYDDYQEPQRRPVVDEDYTEYVDAPETRAPRRDSGPIEFEKPKRAPLFTWRGKPIGGSAEQTPVFSGRPQQRAIEQPRRQTAAARILADGSRDASDVDPQSWFDDTVHASIDRDASDLHIRVEDDGTGYGDILNARVRIDGRMRHLETLSGFDARTIINRFKTNANLSSDGSYVPEETVYEIDVNGELRKARVALFRTSGGGDALVLRLPPQGTLRRLDDLNFAPKNRELVHGLLDSANRMVMIAGPMGSGKTTTATAALLEVTTPERSVWSLEDPVERDLPGVTQLEVDEKNGAGFDALLPVLVRSDYDTLFLGEIRDQATAAAGVRQAKAGRQIITTIHANDNVTALYRLIQLSNDSALDVLDSVAGVISQRLVGKLNPNWDGVDPETKYRGRVPIHEVLRITPELIEAIMRDTPITQVQAIAAASSESTFIGDGQRLVNEYVTDVEEVNRVLGLQG